MAYSVKHITTFRYAPAVRESVMEIRMQPRSEGPQTLRSFQISTNPRAQLYAYTDHLGNAVYHFNLLREHEELPADAQDARELGAALGEALRGDEVERLPREDEAEGAVRLLETERRHERGGLALLARGERGRWLELVHVDPGAATAEVDDALAAQRSEHEHLGTALAEDARDRAAQGTARLPRRGVRGGGRPGGVRRPRSKSHSGP